MENINGPKVVKRIIRPPRIAFIVQTIKDCEEIIKVCSLNWGGKQFCIVPYTNSHIGEDWINFLLLYDPDSIYSCIDLDNETELILLNILNPINLYSKSTKKEEKKEGIPVIHPLTHNVGRKSLSIFNVLANFGLLEDANKLLPIFLPVIDKNDPQALFIHARFGLFDEDLMLSLLLNGDFKNWHMDLEEVFRIKLATFNNDFIEFYSSNEHYNSSSIHYRSLIDATSIGLTEHVSDEMNFIEPIDDSLKNTYNFIIVSDENCNIVEDFCWYWSLRTPRYFCPTHSLLPLWLPLSYVNNNISRISQHLNSSNMSSFSKNRKIIISNSVNNDVLNKLSSELGDDIEIFTDNIYRFYPESYSSGIVDEPEVYFHENRVHFPPPTSNLLKYVPLYQHYFIDINIQNTNLPRVNAGMWGDFPTFHMESYRVSKSGLSFSINGGLDSRPLDFSLPTPWETLQTLFGLADYRIRLSDKGSIAEKIINLISGEENLWIFSGENIYKLFNQMADLSQAKEFRERLKKLQYSDDDIKDIMTDVSKDRHDRVNMTYGDIKNLLRFPAKTTELFIKWALKRKIIFRGKEIICPNCRTKQWMYLEDLKSSFLCNGCQSESDIPLNTNTTQWEYRINTLFAKSIELGIYPHLLTINNYYNKYHGMNNDADSILFPNYGICLFDKSDYEFSNTKMEIDIVMIYKGNIIIGECKTNGKELSQKNIEEYLQLIDEISSSRIIFSTITSFSGIDVEAKNLINEFQSKIEELSHDDLFNVYPGKYLEKIDKDIHKHKLPSEIFEEKLSSYLKYLFNKSII